MPRLPNFFIAGAPKAGTTSLYHYLDQHPEIYMSPLKEPNFFSAEIREANCDPELRRAMERDRAALRKYLNSPMSAKRFGGIVTEYEDYERLFANATTQSAIGEASVCYLWSPTAPVRIAERIPDAKIIVMLRDPAERAFSQYLQGLGNGSIRWTLREHIHRNRNHNSEQLCVHYPFLEFGFYAEQLSRYLERFGPHVWVGFYDDFRANANTALRSISRFLNVNPEFKPRMESAYMEAQVPRASAVGWLKRSGLWQAAAKVTPQRLRPLARRTLVRPSGSARIDPEDRRFLVNFYRGDIRRLEALTGRNLERWLRLDV